MLTFLRELCAEDPNRFVTYEMLEDVLSQAGYGMLGVMGVEAWLAERELPHNLMACAAPITVVRHPDFEGQRPAVEDSEAEPHHQA